MKFLLRATLFGPLLMLLTGAGLDGQVPDADPLVRKARAIHERVITLDTHDDINPANFTRQPATTRSALDTQVNLPKMVEGGLDASFFIVYVGQPRSRATRRRSAAGYERAYRRRSRSSTRSTG